jgi:hypothetical protein
MSYSIKFPPPSGEQPLSLLSGFRTDDWSRQVVRYAEQYDDDIAFAYFDAANKLAETFTGIDSDDLMLLPFLTLYRQAFELQLKTLLKFFVNVRIDFQDDANATLRESVTDDLLKNHYRHNLKKLLDEVVTQYNSLKLPQPFPVTTSELIMQFHEADERGTAFRYAGELPGIQEAVDFPKLADHFKEQFQNLLDLREWDFEDLLLHQQRDA